MEDASSQGKITNLLILFGIYRTIKSTWWINGPCLKATRGRRKIKLSRAGSSIEFLRPRAVDYILCEARYSKSADRYGIYKARIWKSIIYAAFERTWRLVYWKCDGVARSALCWYWLEWTVVHCQIGRRWQTLVTILRWIVKRRENQDCRSENCCW